MEIINHKEYFDAMEKEFPAIAETVKENREFGDHIAMEDFAMFTKIQIENKNYAEMQRCFMFQEDKIDEMNDGLKNALLVSYCESLMLGHMGKEMKKLKHKLPPKLLKEYEFYENYYNGLGSDK